MSACGQVSHQPCRCTLFLAVIYTIGHSTRELAEFLGLLAAHRVAQVVDVRRYPASRRYPQFARDALAAALEATGIRYHHEADLGGAPPRRRGVRAPPAGETALP